MFEIGVVATVAGAIMLILARISFKFRAILNKSAWGGATLPLVVIGIIITIPALVIVYLFYPR
jgi:hypothetical protein